MSLPKKKKRQLRANPLDMSSFNKGKGLAESFSNKGAQNHKGQERKICQKQGINKCQGMVKEKNLGKVVRNCLKEK